ncbi:MAG TPA: autotransporter outer membrane beta-barrel domain-containing protein, partial [Sphingomonas sp.]|nr:autotransporter outer membrane beta-barrel domain-containing protein [Sphingomonas sp.]
PVTVDVGTVVTSGPDSDGIDVTTTTGDQTITAGPITVSGLGSNGIVATSGCAQIAITAEGPIASTAGTGILAESACGVAVTTVPGASIRGGASGIDVTSGTGAAIVIGDTVSGVTGPAINADGAAAAVTVQPTGRIQGYVDLTEGNDTLTNSGTFDATGTSAFGGGTDTLVNTGVIRVLPAATAPGTVAFTGLESTVNGGLVDLRNGQVGDVLTLDGSFTGTGNSQLGVDVAADAGTSDRVVVAGAATGSTALLVNPLGTGVLVNGALVVDAGPGTSSGAFYVPGGAATRGLVDYRIAFDAPANDFRLFGTPNGSAYQQVKLAEGVREIFYRGNDAVDGHFRDLRDAEGGSAGETGRVGSALWGQMYGQWSRYEGDVAAVNFGQTTTARLDYVQDAFGGQIGYDFGGPAAFGITAGYGDHTLRFEATADRFHYKAANVGAYARLNAGAFFINALARYEHYWIDVVSRSAGARDDMDGNSYGAMAQAGVRFGSSGFFVEPAVSIEYARTDLGDLDLPGGSFAFDNSDGLRGKAGVRLGATLSDGPSRIQLYAGGNVVHDFSNDDRTAFTSGGLDLDLVGPRIGTYGEARIGMSAAVGSRVNGFIEANGRLGDGYRGAGGRAGLSIRF